MDRDNDVGDGSGAPLTEARFPEQRRSPRFHFDSLVRLTTLHISEQVELWGRSTDLCQHGIGVTVAGDLTRDGLVSLQIPLPKAKVVTVNASVRYYEQGHCGLEFMELRHSQRQSIQAACEELRKSKR